MDTKVVEDKRQAKAIGDIALAMDNSNKRTVLLALVRAYTMGYQHAEDDYREPETKENGHD